MQMAHSKIEQLIMCARTQVSSRTAGGFGNPCVHFGTKEWNRGSTNLESRVALTKTSPPKLVAATLGALKEDGQLSSMEEIAGPVPEMLEVHEQWL